MPVTDNAKAYPERMFPGYASSFLEADPEFIERFHNFAFDEVINPPGQELDDKPRRTAIPAPDEFSGSRGDFYKPMFAKCPAGRTAASARRKNAAIRSLKSGASS